MKKIMSDIELSKQIVSIYRSQYADNDRRARGLGIAGFNFLTRN